MDKSEEPVDYDFMFVSLQFFVDNVERQVPDSKNNEKFTRRSNGQVGGLEWDKMDKRFYQGLKGLEDWPDVGREFANLLDWAENQ